MAEPLARVKAPILHATGGILFSPASASISPQSLDLIREAARTSTRFCRHPYYLDYMPGISAVPAAKSGSAFLIIRRLTHGLAARRSVYAALRAGRAEGTARVVRGYGDANGPSLGNRVSSSAGYLAPSQQYPRITRRAGMELGGEFEYRGELVRARDRILQSLTCCRPRPTTSRRLS